MHFVFIDFESRWSDRLTLKKMIPSEYLADPEWELQSVSIRIDRPGQPHGATTVHFGETAIRSALDAADIPNAFVIAHNNEGFDSLILVWKLGYSPRMLGCTLAMSRAILGHQTSLGLGALVKHLNIGVKNDAVLHATKGKWLKDFTADELRQMTLYNGDDATQCAAIFYYLLPFYTASELWLLDCTIRAYAFPRFELDQGLLEDTLVKEAAEKRTNLLDLASVLSIPPGSDDDATFEAVRATLASTPKFVALLQQLEVDVPLKTNAKGKFIPALAKTDEGFTDLLDSEDELVANAAAARLSIKSTLLATRIQKLLLARRTATALYIPLKYCGAKVTDRWSGAIFNAQNLPRINKKKPRNSDALRQAIIAPEGYVIGVADQSSIELRLNHHMWKVKRTCPLYAANARADIYRDFASARWRVTPEEVTDAQRQVGKVSHLQLQYGSGWKKFKHTARTQGGLSLDDEEAAAITNDWRQTYSEIPDGWETMAEALYYIAEGTKKTLDPWGLLSTCKEGIMLPNGSLLRYPALRKVEIADPNTGKVKWDWVYGVGRFTRRIYGPKVVANTIQKLGRNVVSEDAIAFFKQTKYRWSSMTHDELIYVWPEKDAPELLACLQAQMRTRRTWWPELVLWSEGGLGHRYSEAH